mgnify:FL=1|tara:strand:- start:437 stop:679 length:243 start_codon:yes stop_codon:yes gene_type:complete
MNKKDLNDLNDRIWDLKDKEFHNEEDPIKQLWSLIVDVSLLQNQTYEEFKELGRTVALMTNAIAIMSQRITDLEKKVNDK